MESTGVKLREMVSNLNTVILCHWRSRVNLFLFIALVMCVLLTMGFFHVFHVYSVQEYLLHEVHN